MGFRAASLGTVGVVGPAGERVSRAYDARSGEAARRRWPSLRADHVDASGARSLEPRAGAIPARRRAGLRPAPSPTSPATISIIIRLSRTISTPRCGCSKNCCRRARRPSSMPIAAWRRSVARRAAAHGLTVFTVGDKANDAAASQLRARRVRPAARCRGAAAAGMRSLAAGRRFPGFECAGRGGPCHCHGRRGSACHACARIAERRARPARSCRHERRTARRSSSTMPTRPMRSRPRFRRLRPYVDGQARRWCSAAAATATRASGR